MIGLCYHVLWGMYLELSKCILHGESTPKHRFPFPWVGTFITISEELCVCLFASFTKNIHKDLVQDVKFFLIWSLKICVCLRRWTCFWSPLLGDFYNGIVTFCTKRKQWGSIYERETLGADFPQIVKEMAEESAVWRMLCTPWHTYSPYLNRWCTMKCCGWAALRFPRRKELHNEIGVR